MHSAFWLSHVAWECVRNEESGPHFKATRPTGPQWFVCSLKNEKQCPSLITNPHALGKSLYPWVLVSCQQNGLNNTDVTSLPVCCEEDGRWCMWKYFEKTVKHHINRASQVVLVVKHLSTNAGDARDVGFNPGSGRPPEKEMATHSVDREFHGQRSQVGTQSMGSQRVRHDWAHSI